MAASNEKNVHVQPYWGTFRLENDQSAGDCSDQAIDASGTPVKSSKQGIRLVWYKWYGNLKT